MSFTANINNACATKYYIGDCFVQHELKKLDPVCDLEVKFDSKLSFSEHINKKIIKLIAFFKSLKEIAYGSYVDKRHFYFTL